MQAQRVLVTAGASGIGREIALGFAAAGAKVFVVDVDANSLEALEREMHDSLLMAASMLGRWPTSDGQRHGPSRHRTVGGTLPETQDDKRPRCWGAAAVLGRRMTLSCGASAS